MIKQKVLLKNETTYRFGGACKNFFLLEDKNDLHNFSEFDTFSKYFIFVKFVVINYIFNHHFWY